MRAIHHAKSKICGLNLPWSSRKREGQARNLVENEEELGRWKLRDAVWGI